MPPRRQALGRQQQRVQHQPGRRGRERGLRVQPREVEPTRRRLGQPVRQSLQLVDVQRRARPRRPRPRAAASAAGASSRPFPPATASASLAACSSPASSSTPISEPSRPLEVVAEPRASSSAKSRDRSCRSFRYACHGVAHPITNVTRNPLVEFRCMQQQTRTGSRPRVSAINRAVRAPPGTPGLGSRPGAVGDRRPDHGEFRERRQVLVNARGRSSLDLAMIAAG